MNCILETAREAILKRMFVKNFELLNNMTILFLTLTQVLIL
ncbi:hypothetical protein [Spiroplasma endosymbiont of Nebria brevicollis]